MARGWGKCVTSDQASDLPDLSFPFCQNQGEGMLSPNKQPQPLP